jgi:hypothetical protein
MRRSGLSHHNGIQSDEGVPHRRSCRFPLLLLLLLVFIGSVLVARDVCTSAATSARAPKARQVVAPTRNPEPATLLGARVRPEVDVAGREAAVASGSSSCIAPRGWLTLSGCLRGVPPGIEAVILLTRLTGQEFSPSTPGGAPSTLGPTGTTSHGVFAFTALLPGRYSVEARIGDDLRVSSLVDVWADVHDLELECHRRRMSPIDFESLWPEREEVRNGEERLRVAVRGPSPVSQVGPVGGILEISPLVAERWQRVEVELGIDGVLRRPPGSGVARSLGSEKAPGDDRSVVVDELGRGCHRVRLDLTSYAAVEQEVAVGLIDVVILPLKRVDGSWVTVDLPERPEGRWTLDARAAEAKDGAWAQLLHFDERMPRRQGAAKARAFLPEGSWDFRLTSTQHPPVELRSVWIDARGDCLVLRPLLQEGLRIHGTVRGPEAPWMDGAEVHVLRRVTGDQWSCIGEKTTTIRAGRYEIAGLAPGVYRLSLSPSGTPVLAEVIVVARDVEQDLVVDPRSRVPLR